MFQKVSFQTPSTSISSSSLLSSSKIKILFPVSSASELVILIDRNGFVSSSKSLDTCICDFSICLPAAQGSDFSEQWILRSSEASTFIFRVQDLNNWLIISAGKNAYNFRIYSAIRFQRGALRLSSAISLYIPSSVSRWSYLSAHIVLKALLVFLFFLIYKKMSLKNPKNLRKS